MPIRINKRGLPLLFLMLFAAQAPGHAGGEPLPSLRPIGQAELSEALAKGEPIHHRVIGAQQIMDAVTGQARGGKAVKKIDISDSTITGNLTLDASLTGSLTIRNSTVQQCLSLSGIKSAPEIDLSGTSFSDCVAIRDCRLTRLSASKAEFHQQLYIANSEIKEQLDMTSATFDRSCSFRNVHIDGQSNFTSTDFHQGARFLAWFHGVAFANALFRKTAVFDESHFFGPASTEFYETEFDELAKFMEVTLHPAATPTLGEAVHRGVAPLRFDTTRFNGDFSLSTKRGGPQVPAEVDFQDVLWHGNAYFIDSDMSRLQLADFCVLEKRLSLSSSRIEKLVITRSELRGGADFIDSHFDSVVLAGTNFGGNVNFHDSDWSRLDLEDSHFEAGLAFGGACRECRGFLAIQPNTTETWHSVAEAAERGGDQTVANQAYYNEQLALRRKGFFKRSLSYVPRLWWGFGVRPLWTFYWLLGWILVWAFIYGRRTAPPGTDGAPPSRLERYETIFLFSLMSAFRWPGRSLKAARERSLFKKPLHASFEVVILLEFLLVWATVAFLLIAAYRVWPPLKEITGVLLPK